jgi:hypothetical protein
VFIAVPLEPGFEGNFLYQKTKKEEERTTAERGWKAPGGFF